MNLVRTVKKHLGDWDRSARIAVCEQIRNGGVSVRGLREKEREQLAGLLQALDAAGWVFVVYSEVEDLPPVCFATEADAILALEAWIAETGAERTAARTANLDGWTHAGVRPAWA